MVAKAEIIFKNWLGRKKNSANFWKPYFKGQKMNKIEVKNLKRYLRRTLLEIFLNTKMDRHLVENMSDTTFQKKV